MSFAADIMNLRREIDSLHASRKAMIHRLNRFRADLRKNMTRSMTEFHKTFGKECARNRAFRHAFAAHNQDLVSQMLGTFCTERAAARRNFLGKRA